MVFHHFAVDQWVQDKMCMPTLFCHVCIAFVNRKRLLSPCLWWYLHVFDCICMYLHLYASCMCTAPSYLHVRSRIPKIFQQKLATSPGSSSPVPASIACRVLIVRNGSLLRPDWCRAAELRCISDSLRACPQQLPCVCSHRKHWNRSSSFDRGHFGDTTGSIC